MSAIANCQFLHRLDGKGRGSMSSDAKGMAESDTDSMAEYGEGDAGKNSVRSPAQTTNFHVALYTLLFLYVHQVGTPITENHWMGFCLSR